MSDRVLLFSRRSLGDLLEECKVQLLESIDSVEESRVISSATEDVIGKHHQVPGPTPLKLVEGEILTDRQDVELEPQRFGTLVRSMGRIPKRVATIVTFHVPFEGDPSLWNYRPTTFTTSPPVARIEDAELILEYEIAGRDPSEVRREFDRDLAEIKQWLGWIERDVSQSREVTRPKALERLENRRKRILDGESVLSGLGFPLRRRAESPQTYRVPEIRRKIEATNASEQLSIPHRDPIEPTLDETEYEHILSVMNNMVAVMERSPKTFRDMREEDLRQHFLVQLNGQYEGQASGETFNFEGKTDILIRWQGRNLFIAECKFWQGKSSLQEALDQLLRYTTWKDTKTAVLLFNRGRLLSDACGRYPRSSLSTCFFSKYAIR